MACFRPCLGAPALSTSPPTRVCWRPGQSSAPTGTPRPPSLRYEAVEQACRPDGHSAFVRIHFDWGTEKVRLRSNYVVIYRFRDRLIVGQELYYDPSGQLERLS
ncbi:MAG: hypothetical protein V3T33_07710 [Myxococcota bacterium]